MVPTVATTIVTATATAATMFMHKVMRMTGATMAATAEIVATAMANVRLQPLAIATALAVSAVMAMMRATVKEMVGDGNDDSGGHVDEYVNSECGADKSVFFDNDSDYDCDADNDTDGDSDADAGAEETMLYLYGDGNEACAGAPQVCTCILNSGGPLNLII